MRIYIYACICTHRCIHTYTTHACGMDVYIHIHTHTTHACGMDVYIHIHTHIYTHTHHIVFIHSTINEYISIS